MEVCPDFLKRIELSYRNLKQLDRLNSRLIIAISGFKNILKPPSYWSLGLEPFDPR